MGGGDIGKRRVVGELCNVVEEIEVYKASLTSVQLFKSCPLTAFG